MIEYKRKAIEETGVEFSYGKDFLEFSLDLFGLASDGLAVKILELGGRYGPECPMLSGETQPYAWAAFRVWWTFSVKYFVPAALWWFLCWSWHTGFVVEDGQYGGSDYGEHGWGTEHGWHWVGYIPLVIAAVCFLFPGLVCKTREENSDIIDEEHEEVTNTQSAEYKMKAATLGASMPLEKSLDNDEEAVVGEGSPVDSVKNKPMEAI